MGKSILGYVCTTRWFNDRQVRDARAGLRQAQADLENYGKRQKQRNDDTETDEYLRLNKAVNDARANLRQARP